MEREEMNTKLEQPAGSEPMQLQAVNQELEQLRKEVAQLREDLEFMGRFQKKPIISADVIGVVGFYIVVILAVIGIFF